MELLVTVFVFIISSCYLVCGQMITEIYETCTPEQGELAKCGLGANCFIINKVPTCHCIVDVASGLPLAGNPYKACTWDLTGEWKLYSYVEGHSGLYKEILSPASNEPFIVRLDRTDAILKTKYITGAIFVITAITSFALGICGRAFLDANDNTTVIFEQSAGFVDNAGKSILLRTRNSDTSLMKVHPVRDRLRDKFDLRGQWQKNDGTEIQILDLKKPWNNRASFTTRNWSAFWYDDPSFGSPQVRLSTALFVDRISQSERVAFNTNLRFVQVGWYGALNMGSSRILIYSPADGKPIFTLLRLNDVLPKQPSAIITSQTSIPSLLTPSIKEYISTGSVTEFQISVDTAAHSSDLSTTTTTTLSPSDHIPATRFFGSNTEVLVENRVNDVLSAAKNILSGILPSSANNP